HVMAADRHALLPRLRLIMNEDQPALPNWDEAAWMAQTYDNSEALGPELESWHKAREGLAQKFSELELSNWNRSGSHPLRGERTLLWWLEYCVHHTRDHWLQLQKILAGTPARRDDAGYAEEAS
ncbi:MAG: DinB family protein, partial [Anaerolineales bacterium]